jgi:hypothetical protein
LVPGLSAEGATATSPTAVVDVVGEQAFGCPGQQRDSSRQLIAHRFARCRPRVSPGGPILSRERWCRTREPKARRSQRRSRFGRRVARATINTIFLLVQILKRVCTDLMCMTMQT